MKGITKKWIISMTAINRKMAGEEKREDDTLIIKYSQGRDME